MKHGLVAIILIFIVSKAQAKSRIALLAGTNSTSIDVSVSSGSFTLTLGETNSTTQYGGGLLAEFDIKNDWTIELTALYMPRGFEGATSKTKYQFNAIQGHLLIRKWTKNRMFNGGVGLYTAQGSGKVKVTEEDGTESEVEFDDDSVLTGIKPNDMGFLISGQFNWHFTQSMSLIFDIRYLEGMSNILADSGDFKADWNETQGFIGFGWNL